MIPYDDLVVALANWRAKQGLGAPMPTTAAAPQAQVAKTGSGPRTAPPAPAPSAGSGPNKPAPAPAPAPVVDVDETLYEEDEVAVLDHLEAPDEEATSIGSAPSRDSFGGQTDPLPNPTGANRSAGNRNDDW